MQEASRCICAGVWRMRSMSYALNIDVRVKFIDALYRAVIG